MTLKAGAAESLTVEFSHELLTLIDKVAKARKTSRSSLVRKLVIDGLAELTYPEEAKKETAKDNRTNVLTPELKDIVAKFLSARLVAQFIATEEGDLSDPEIRKLAVQMEVMKHGVFEMDKGWTYRGKFIPVSKSEPKPHNCHLKELEDEFD